ncbi:WD40 repeat-like protein [Rhizopogon vinicolor AM-OR11-026]|uniref:WD40 repeat-like protein n=1 Tax=Rhizopogon vinicolor AM-OR11-026 TaxID=1314800 RepID=A0A1B7N2G2_9AGAM|nr:WD40 repeat-like protein [Rhizopogon vinicolor AM-OR11-026]
MMQSCSDAAKMMLKPIMTLECPAHREYFCESMSYFPDGKRIISGLSDKIVRQWDLQTGKEIENARDVHEHEVLMVAVSRDGRWVVTVAGEGVDILALKAWETETGIVKTFVGHSRAIGCIDISVDSSLLASGSDDSTARIWSLETGKLVAGPFKTAGVYVGAIRFSQDSKKLAVNSFSMRCLEVWDIETETLDVRIGKASKRGYSPSPSVFWTNKGTILAAFRFTLDDEFPGTIYEFDPSTLDTVGAPFEGHTKYIHGLALSFDGALFASISWDNTIKLWALESHQLLASFDVLIPRYIIFSPVSHQLAYATSALEGCKIYICNIPPDILASIGPAVGGRRTSATLGDLLESDATRPATRPAGARRTRVISPVISSSPRPPRALPSREPQQPAILRHLHNFLRFSSFKNTIPTVQNIQPRDPLDFPATTSLPPNRSPSAQATVQGRSQNSRLMPSTTLSSTTAPAISKSHLLSWRAIREGHTGHVALPIVDVPFTRGDERNAAAGALRGNGGYTRDEDFDPPPPDPDSQQSSAAVQMNSGQHGSGRLCFCF